MDYNRELAESRASKKHSLLMEERQQAQQDAERDQWAYEQQKLEQQKKQQMEREAYLKLEVYIVYSLVSMFFISSHIT